MTVQELIDAVLLARESHAIPSLAFPPTALECPETASMYYDAEEPGAWDRPGEEAIAGIGVHFFPLAVLVCAEIWRGEYEDERDDFSALQFQAAVWAADNPEHAAVIQVWASTLPDHTNCDGGPSMLTVWAHIAGPTYADGSQSGTTLASMAKQFGYTTMGAEFDKAVDMAQHLLLYMLPAPVHAALQDWRDVQI